MTAQLHLKYVATLPCNLSLIAYSLTLMFHKVEWQHLQAIVGFLNNLFTANLLENLPVKIENRLRFNRSVVMSLWPRFYWPTLHVRRRRCGLFATVTATTCSFFCDTHTSALTYLLTTRELRSFAVFRGELSHVQHVRPNRGPTKRGPHKRTFLKKIFATW